MNDQGSVKRVWSGIRFTLEYSLSDSALDLLAKQEETVVGKLTGGICSGASDSMAWDADSVDDHGPEVIQGITHLSEQLQIFCDDFTVFYLGRLSAEGRGRRIGCLLCREAVNVVRSRFPKPFFCWYACPLAGEESVQQTDRLIDYYRRMGAINPCKNKRIMLWDPLGSLPGYDIHLVDMGARPVKKRRPLSCRV